MSNRSDRLFEFACDRDSNLGEVSAKYGIDHVRLNKEFIDLSQKEGICQLIHQIKDGDDLMISIPCAVYSTWQYMSIIRHGPSYLKKLLLRRQRHKTLLLHALKVAEHVINRGGVVVAFEWPKTSLGWLIPELLEFIQRHGLYEAVCAGCFFGMTDDEGRPMLKQ